MREFLIARMDVIAASRQLMHDLKNTVEVDDPGRSGGQKANWSGVRPSIFQPANAIKAPEATMAATIAWSFHAWCDFAINDSPETVISRLTIELRCAVDWRPACRRKLGDRPLRHLE